MGNILLINGVLVPEPTGMKPNEYDITKSNRTVTGLMKGHVVRHDVHKIECSWKVLGCRTHYVCWRQNKRYIEICGWQTNL